MVNILVTGEKGFIGSYLRSYLNRNHNVISFPKRISFKNRLQLINSQSSDAVVHAAAKTSINQSWNSPKDLIKSNLESTKCIIEYCIKNDALLIFISSYLYGNAKNLPTSEKDEIKINNPYAHSKKLCEDLCRIYQKKNGLRLSIIRPFNIYGYFKDSDLLIMSIFRRIRKEKSIIVTDLKPKRDFLYIDDFCKMVELIIKKNITDQVFNAGSGINFSVNEIIEIIQKICSSDLKVKISSNNRKNEILETLADISKAKELLDWQPEWSFEDGIKQTFELSNK